MSDAVAKAEAAKRLLEDPLLTEVLDGIESAAIEAWASSPIEAVERREYAFYALNASRRVRSVLRGVVDDGIVAASQAVKRAARP